MVIFSLTAIKVHDNVSQYAAPYSSSFSSVSIQHIYHVSYQHVMQYM